MPRIVQCPSCSSKLKLPDDAKKSRCPKCSRVFEIGSPQGTATKRRVEAKPVQASSPSKSSQPRRVAAKPRTPPDSQGAKKSVCCPKCQATLKVSASALGKNVRCPKCSNTFAAGVAQEQTPTPVQASPEPFEPFGGDDLFSSLPSEPNSQTPELDSFGLAPASPELLPPVAVSSSGGYQPYAPPPAPRKRRAKRPTGDWKSWLTEPRQLLQLLAIVGIGSFVLSAIPLVGWAVFALVIASYVVIQMVGGIWMIVIAFEEDVIQGLLYLFLPLYAVFYLITRWDSCRVPFMMCMVSLLSVICSFPGMMIGTIILGIIVGPQR